MSTKTPPDNVATADTSISSWGNGLGVRLTAPLAKASGFVHGARVRVHALPGVVYVVAESSSSVTLARMKSELEAHLSLSAAAVEEVAIQRMHEDTFASRNVFVESKK